MSKICMLLSAVALFVSVADAGFLDWFRSSANKGHRICKVDFEVMEPQGLKLWTAHKPETKMFGIELYINPTGTNDQCNLCKNSTEVTHGKFFINDDNVIVKKGDVLEYVAITDNGKTVQRHKRKKLVVNDYIIKPQGRCACSSPVPFSSVHDSEPSGEIELLERIIANLSNRCADGAVSNLLFLQVSSAAGPTNPLERVKSYLSANSALKPYTGTVTKAEDYTDGIAFELKTIVDKLKILELSHTGTDIVDYDGFTTIDKLDIRLSNDA